MTDVVDTPVIRALPPQKSEAAQHLSVWRQDCTDLADAETDGFLRLPRAVSFQLNKENREWWESETLSIKRMTEGAFRWIIAGGQK